MVRRALAGGVLAAALLLGAACGEADDAATAPGTSDTTAAEVTTPERCLGGGDPAPEYVGLTEDEAKAKAASAGVPFRVVGRDDECFMRTEDHVPNRVNVVTVDGRVAAAGRF